MKKDNQAFGEQFRKSYEAQVTMLPNMENEEVKNTIEKYRDSTLGWKLSGAGGGGYLVFVSENPIPGAVKIHIRR